ncbi:AMMECR1 family protein, partial [Patescibacteria group bacterium]|nr:AMMECR1 family protein [Patescibacteria group bacterium]
MSFLFNKNRKQLKAIFNWLSGVVSQNDLILVERERKREGYCFEFPLKFSDKPEKLKCIDDKDFSFFIKFSFCQTDIDGKEWKLIFQSPELEIYENEKRFENKQFKPLRWGLNEEEKRTALKIARESIRIFLEEKQTPQIKDFNFSLAAVFNLRADLDVALWTNGVVRGSWVVENTFLGEGIIEAAIYASRDSRFKPLEFDELKNTRIEITLFSDLKIPLSKSLIDKDEILYNKGYLLKRGEKQGWFLPEVFNVLSFKNLKEFLFRLGAEKAFLRPEEVFDKKTAIFIFEVDDFIEGEEKEEILNLVGPAARAGKLEGEIKETAISAADWLLKMQELDGNFVPITNPITGRASQIDWPRSIFTGWSLIEFGKVVGNPRYIDAGRKNFSYGKKYILE